MPGHPLEKTTALGELEGAHTRITLLPARLDFKSPKVQMIAGWVFALILCLTVYLPTLKVGFLLDDFLHIDYVFAALRGDWSPFLANFTGNWAGSDLMKSYRPVVSLSIFLDALRAGADATAYHWTNIILAFGCSCFSGLIAMEISGNRGNRLGAAAAVWVACLFSVYPLHAESVAWIIGRVDLLCTFFYLVSVWCYFRFRLLREKSYYHISLASFVLALLSKEMAVTLPVVIMLAEILIFGKEDAQSLPEKVRANRLVQRVSIVMSYFFVLGFCAGMRLLLLGTLVGGYGSDAAGINLSNLKDKATLLKVVFPFHEEFAAAAWIKPTLIAGYAGALLVFAVRCCLRSIKPGAFLFLLAWCALAILPTYQIWHIWPNLVGSRLFFTSSVPFCIILSLLALPTVDKLSRKWVTPLCLVGVASLSAVLISWTALSELSVKPWVEAGKQMSQARRLIVAELEKIDPAKKVLFLNLPTDYSGAGMLTRELYLKMACRPPFTSSDLSNRIETIEPPISGSHEFVWPQKLRNSLANPATSKVFVWSADAGNFVPYQPAAAVALNWTVKPPSESFKLEDPGLSVTPINEWKKVDASYSAVEAGDGILRVRPGKKSVVLRSLLADGMTPLSADLWEFIAKTSAKDQIKDKVWLVWKAKLLGGKGPLVERKAPFFRVDDQHWISHVGRHRDWSLAGVVESLAVQFEPGDYEVDLLSLNPQLSADRAPHLVLAGTNESGTGTSKPRLEYANAKDFKLIFSQPGKTFEASFPGEVEQPTTILSGKPALELPLAEPAGVMEIPEQIRTIPGVYQVRLVGAKGSKWMLPGEPVTFEVTKSDSGQGDIRIVQ